MVLGMLPTLPTVALAAKGSYPGWTEAGQAAEEGIDENDVKYPKNGFSLLIFIEYEEI